MTVQELIEKNHNERVMICRRFTDDETDPMQDILHDGYLDDTPEHLRGLEVCGTAWSVGHECPTIDIFIPGHVGDDAIEKLKSNL